MASRFGFDKIIQKMDRLKRELPPIVGNMGQRFFVDSFSSQGWTDAGFEAWQKPQRMTEGTPSYKYPKRKDLGRRSRAILIGKSGGTKSGSHTHLRQSVNTSLKTAVWDDILFSVPQAYARRHNEGLGGMPKRQFIGNSQTLISLIKNRIDRDMKIVLSPR